MWLLLSESFFSRAYVFLCLFAEKMTGSYIVFSYDTIIRAKNSPQDCFLNARSNPFGYLADKNLWGTFGYPINFGPPEGI